MSAIANQWTGAGLPSGTTITADNVNASGNGATVTASGLTTGGSPMVKEGNGVRIVAEATSTVRRFDAVVSGTALRTQVRLKADAFPVGGNMALLMIRSSTAVLRTVVLGPDGIVGIGGAGAAAFAPAIAVGDQVLLDLVVTQASSPTTTNGRVFYRMRNLSNPTWASGGEFFYDSGYTIDAGTVAYAQVRFGKQSTETIPTPGVLMEFLGWETITVTPSHTSEAQAKTYFADAPVAAVQPSAGPVRPLPGAGTGSTGWSILGSAASEGEALSDVGQSRLTTGIISPEINSGTTTERVFQLAPLVPFTTGQTFEVDVTADVISTPTPTTRVRFFNGSTVVATKVVTLPAGVADGPAPTQPVTVTLTATETAALNPLDIRVGIQAVR